MIEKVYQKNNQSSILTAYIALGFFDGVHLGHQRLIKWCVKESKKAHAISTVVLFDPHPAKIIHRLKCYELLMPISERVDQIKKLGIEQIILIKFDKEFQKMNAEDFIIKILLDQLKMGAVFVGYNYHFGFQKRGNPEIIKELGQIHHFKYYILSPQKLDSAQKISSSLIKKELKEGNIEQANDLLGYAYQLNGKVIHGNKRGNQVLSFPTANLEIPIDKLLPKNGVYIVFARAKKKQYRGLVNIGYRPTFNQNQKKMSVEVHLFDFKEDIYNQKITISLLKKIRNEKEFGNIHDLIAQIQKDKITADLYFDEFSFNLPK